MVGLLGAAADGNVLDVGCGPGRYLARLGTAGGRRVGLDLSEGMTAIAKGRAPAAAIVCGDASMLPFSAATFDAVLAPHMLYHVPDMGLAAAELARVLRPGGTAAVVTNGERHMREVVDLGRSAVGDLAPDAAWDGWHRFTERFTLETGADVLEPALRVVRVEQWRSSIAVPEVEPVVAYVDSTRSLLEPRLPDGVSWDGLLDRVRRRVTEHIDSSGAWRARTHVGAFVCRRPSR